jgi:hypothetical protein
MGSVIQADMQYSKIPFLKQQFKNENKTRDE